MEGERTVGYRIRVQALKHHIPCITTLAALRAAVAAIRGAIRSGGRVALYPLKALGQRD